MGYVLLAAIAAAGLLASMGCHILAWMEIEPPAHAAVFVLHLGFLVLWFPLVQAANRTTPKSGGGNVEHLFAELPPWVRVAISVLFVYALLNFAYFIVVARQFPKHRVPFSVELRGFSGHWMFFYGAATAGFVALARLARRQKN